MDVNRIEGIIDTLEQEVADFEGVSKLSTDIASLVNRTTQSQKELVSIKKELPLAAKALSKSASTFNEQLNAMESTLSASIDTARDERVSWSELQQEKLSEFLATTEGAQKDWGEFQRIKLSEFIAATKSAQKDWGERQEKISKHWIKQQMGILRNTHTELIVETKKLAEQNMSVSSLLEKQTGMLEFIKSDQSTEFHRFRESAATSKDELIAANKKLMENIDNIAAELAGAKKMSAQKWVISYAGIGMIIAITAATLLL